MRIVARTFTMVEILVVLAIIGILSSLILPALSTATEQAFKLHCIANMKEIGQGFLMYVDDNNWFLPPARDGATPEKYWNSLRENTGFLYPYLGSSPDGAIGKNNGETKYRCKSYSGTDAQAYMYGYNEHFSNVNLLGFPEVRRYRKIKIPSQTLLLGEVSNRNALINYYDPINITNTNVMDLRHRDMSANALHCDGHTSTATYDSVPWRPGGYKNLYWYPNP